MNGKQGVFARDIATGSAVRPQRTVEEIPGNTDLKGETAIPPDGPCFISADQAVKTML